MQIYELAIGNELTRTQNSQHLISRLQKHHRWRQLQRRCNSSIDIGFSHLTSASPKYLILDARYDGVADRVSAVEHIVPLRDTTNHVGQLKTRRLQIHHVDSCSNIAAVTHAASGGN
jgi:hypothetical protein